MHGVAETLTAVSGLESCPKGHSVYWLHTRSGEGTEATNYTFVPEGTPGIGNVLRETVFAALPDTTDYTFTHHPRAEYMAERFQRGIQNVVRAGLDSWVHMRQQSNELI